MALHQQTADLLAFLASLGNPPLSKQTVEQARAGYAAMRVVSTVELPEVRDINAGGITCRLYRPTRETTGLCMYFHGGGFVIGDLESHDDVCRKLAVSSGHAVLAVDYRLAPEHRFPAAVDDAIAATRRARDHAGSSESTRRASPSREILRAATSPQWSPCSAALILCSSC